MTRPWNWCFKCKQTVDVEPDSNDGSEHKCWGCGRLFTLVVYGDGSVCGLYSESQLRREYSKRHKKIREHVHRSMNPLAKESED